MPSIAPRITASSEDSELWHAIDYACELLELPSSDHAHRQFAFFYSNGAAEFSHTPTPATCGSLRVRNDRASDHGEQALDQRGLFADSGSASDFVSALIQKAVDFA
jgi:hypothetical protein